ncbi:unnamed protein product [Ectocarpus sp. 8 AP-2014]
MIRARAAAFFDDDENDGAPAPTWIMGIPYTELREEERRLDVFSTMWITYRSGFPKMEPYGYTDDSGWGCMLRSAQMLMTQALQRHTLGRSWRVPRTLEERLRVPEYRTLVRLFADHPGEANLFSIHNMCQVGIRYDKLPGEWYGPTTAACVLRDISEIYAERLSPPASPPEPPSSSTGRLRPAEVSAAPDEPAAAGDACRGEAASGTSLEGGENVVEGGSERESGASPAANGGASGCGGGDGDACGSPSGGNGDGAVFPSSRPLRVFVSQGDVVYIDEVEAVAVRGASDTATTATAANGHGAVSGGEHREEANGSATTGDGSSSARSDAAADSTDSPAAAFFDPLLNPGSGEGENPLEKAWSSAVVLLVPLRLGLDELSAGYIPSLLETLRVPQSLGFLGGRPNHAIFFIGAQGNTLTGLDPHTTQPAADMGEGFPSERYVHSLHCQSAVSMDVHRIDPSLALAFYLPDRATFEDLIKRIGETNPPPFSVEQTRPDYEGEMGLAFMINQRDDDGTTDDDDDEYVFVKGPER